MTDSHPPPAASSSGAAPAASFDLAINANTYQWTGRFMRFLRRLLKVNIRLHHHDGDAIAAGDIFLFNHFARFETFIPQYLFYEQGGHYCRSVADHALFKPDDRFSQFLLAIGAVPNRTPDLLAVLAAEALRGRKIIIFPEGGMVKDRQVLDGSGQYSIYSRSAKRRRKQHSGAAVIALALEMFKRAVRLAEQRGDGDRLDAWVELLEFDDRAALLEVARRPTLIVPANITFYPMRVRGNPLARGAEYFNRGLSPRLREELLVEGNILLKNTDMDIRLGEPIRAADFWSERERRLVDARAAKLGTLQEALTAHAHRADHRLRAAARDLQVDRVRDAYMHAMYQLVTVNLSHLAALCVYELLEDDRVEIDVEQFHLTLYLAVKNLQQRAAAYPHPSLLNPENYQDLPEGQCEGLAQLLRTAALQKLIDRDGSYYRFLPKLRQEHGFDQIRLENPIEVYANEVAPIRPAIAAVTAALAEAAGPAAARLAELRMDDELRALEWDRRRFDGPRFESINRQQRQSEDAEPFLFQPAPARRTGVLLVHGFLAGPAEMRGLAEGLSQQGYVCLGVRLKGHGTSPWDLHERGRGDWQTSVRRGYQTLSLLVDQIVVVGFSTGGTLALLLAAERPAALAGVVAIAAPMRFMNKNMRLIPLLHGTNKLVGLWREYSLGIKLFQPNDSEHPHINYLHMPIRALYELGRLVEESKKRFADVRCATLIVQGDRDPVIDPYSAKLLYDALSETRRQVLMIDSERHGIVYEDIGDTRAAIERFIGERERASDVA